MRILVVGAGALGGYFGARLLAAGRDVTFLVRPGTAALLAGHGLRLRSAEGDLALGPPPTVLAGDLAASPRGFGLIVLSAKAHDLGDAMESFAPAVGGAGADGFATAILPLLNGMAHMDALDGRFGRGHVLGGATTISAVRDEDGLIRHLNRLQTLHFGDRDEPDGERIRAIAERLTVAGIDAEMRPRILQDMWDKWISIATGAGMTCLMRAPIGAIVAAGGAGLVRQLLAETAAIAAGEGFQPSERLLEVVGAKWTEAGSPFKASMLHALEAGQPIEAQQIVGDLLELGRRRGLKTPLLETVWTHLRCYEVQVGRGSGHG